MADDTWLRNRARWQYRSRPVDRSNMPAETSTENSECDVQQRPNCEQAEGTANPVLIDRDRDLPRATVAFGLQQVFRQREAAALFGVSSHPLSRTLMHETGMVVAAGREVVSSLVSRIRG